jgi:hypothetical protein
MLHRDLHELDSLSFQRRLLHQLIVPLTLQETTFSADAVDFSLEANRPYHIQRTIKGRLLLPLQRRRIGIPNLPTNNYDPSNAHFSRSLV